jgi:hypothetical protein
VRQNEIADLDDPPLCVQMVQGRAADDLTGMGVDRGEREQAAHLGERRKLFDRGSQPGAVESRQVARLAHLRIGERRQDRVDVLARWKAEDDVAGTEAFARDPEAHGRLAHAR